MRQTAWLTAFFLFHFYFRRVPFFGAKMEQTYVWKNCTKIAGSRCAGGCGCYYTMHNSKHMYGKIVDVFAHVYLLKKRQKHFERFFCATCTKNRRYLMCFFYRCRFNVQKCAVKHEIVPEYRKEMEQKWNIRMAQPCRFSQCSIFGMEQDLKKWNASF